jgi:hypothetical protein
MQIVPVCIEIVFEQMMTVFYIYVIYRMKLQLLRLLFLLIHL